MTNVLFMTFFYAAIFPSGFFFGAATLGVHYWVDKCCLLRNWARAPIVGSQVADMSRNYFLTSALAVYALMASYNFASFPFDNACELDTTITSEYVGHFNATDGEGKPVSFSIAEGGRNYKFCNQDMLRYRIPAFPAVPSNQPSGSEWMRPEQSFTEVFGWTSVWVILFVVGIFLNEFRKNVKHLLWSRYEVWVYWIGYGLCSSAINQFTNVRFFVCSLTPGFSKPINGFLKSRTFQLILRRC